MIMNNVKVCSLEELKKNFNIMDLLYNFYSGKLEKWLLEIGLTEKSDKIHTLEKEEHMLISKICVILEINPDLTEEETRYL